MQYVILAQHNADTCPTSNANVRKRAHDMGAQIGALQTKHNVKIVSGPLILGLSHKTVIIVDAPSVEAVRDFGMEAGIVQWNDVEIYPSWTMEEAMTRAAALEPIPW